MKKIRILTIEALNYNVRRLVTEKPDGYQFEPGQATLVALDKDGFRDEKRPFTFTSLPSEEHLEFTIKTYPSHQGVTHAIDDLNEGDHLLIEDAWGAITFKGKGTFIAGGAGLTPFLAILRNQSHKEANAANLLIFSNNKKKDLFLEDELMAYTEKHLLLTFTGENVAGAETGRVDTQLLKRHLGDFGQFFYVCGPPEMVDSVSEDLKNLGADPDKIIVEAS